VEANRKVSIECDPYKSLVEELMPSQVVADRFHVMKQVNNELDAERKKTKREVARHKEQPEFEQILAGITNKYALLKMKTPE